MIESQVRTLEALASELASAIAIKEKVSLAARIFGVLSECEKMVEQFIMPGMPTQNGNNAPHGHTQAPAGRTSSPINRDPTSKRFKGMSLADIAAGLLANGVVMHGHEIERIAKLGGFKSEAKHFQSYLSVALKRKGGFENIGKNTWRLNEAVEGDARAGRSEIGTDGVSTRVTRKAQLHAWLAEFGPATREEIINGAGLPAGSASSILSVEKDLFKKRDDGKWQAL